MEKRIFVVSTQRLLTLLQYLLILSEYSLTIYGLTSITLAISRSIADNRSAYVSFFSFLPHRLKLNRSACVPALGASEKPCPAFTAALSVIRYLSWKNLSGATAKSTFGRYIISSILNVKNPIRTCRINTCNNRQLLNIFDV
jgi:hypothetical protein